MTDLTAVFNTSRGTIRVKLTPDLTPLTVASFANLAKRGFYNGLNFHRVISNFMIQGGCPEGSGRGGPGYRFADEFHPELKHTGSGILSMANSGPSSNGSQFFICEVATPHLDGKHSVFGQVFINNALIAKITHSPTSRDKPLTDIRLDRVEIFRSETVPTA